MCNSFTHVFINTFSLFTSLMGIFITEILFIGVRFLCVVWLFSHGCFFISEGFFNVICFFSE
ncbi:hypothetical protein BDF14DRAFT_1752928 [Spinellus fusiger]|nr:hypothetical protein BDF14DRAFT_1752928 [Spinellus fusiger]